MLSIRLSCPPPEVLLNNVVICDMVCMYIQAAWRMYNGPTAYSTERT